ncbi:MAG TPA: hypothetical protein VFL42_08420 [Terriglobales bacterium]|nr:hypothetical protein [Terriglobales bacterium]
MAAMASFDYPVLRKEWFDEWPSFKWEIPAMWWFFGIAIVLGVIFALILHVVPRESRILSLSWAAESSKAE